MNALPAVLFRANAGSRVGFGHLKRCLAIARACADQGMPVRFLVATDLPSQCQGLVAPLDPDARCLSLDLAPDLEEQALGRMIRESRPGCLVADHYGVGEDYGRMVRGLGLPWLEFDACRKERFQSDLVLNFTLHSDRCPYADKEFASPAPVLLLGGRHAPIQPAFQRLRREYRFQESVDQVLLSFGGGDDRGMARMALERLPRHHPDIKFTLFTTSANPRAEELAGLARELGDTVAVHLDHPDIPGAMAQSGLAVMAGGMMSYEAACLGLPSLLARIADNQADNAARFQELGLALDLGDSRELSPEALQAAFDRLVADRDLRQAMHRACREQIDGQGAQRIAAALARAATRQEVAP